MKYNKSKNIIYTSLPVLLLKYINQIQLNKKKSSSTVITDISTFSAFLFNTRLNSSLFSLIDAG
jgi:hypothetical protein